MRVAMMRAVALALLVFCARAHASPSDTVVVMSADPGFVRAVEAVLGAAAIRSVAIGDAEPVAGADPTSVPRQLADREHAAAAVVLAAGTDGATLIAYDRGVDRALVRVLHDRVPLGPRARAEAAHMVRTMLRAVRVPPDLALPPDPEGMIEMGDATPQDAGVASAPGVIVRDAGVVVPDAGGVVPDAGVLAVALAGGVRVGAPGSASRAGGDVQLVWRPDAPGLAATVSLVGSARVEAASFAGTVSDTVGAVTARLPIGLAPGWRLTGELGGSVHRIQLAGSAPEPMGPKPPMPPMGPMPPKPPMPAMGAMGPVHIVRYEPALRLGASLVYVASPSISAGLGAWVDALIVRQNFQVASQPILDVPAVQVTVSVTVVARIL